MLPRNEGKVNHAVHPMNRMVCGRRRGMDVRYTNLYSPGTGSGVGSLFTS